MEENSPLPEESKQTMIDLSSEESINYWATRLLCSKADLHYAILNVGHSYTSVEAFLCMNQRQKTQVKQN